MVLLKMITFIFEKNPTGPPCVAMHPYFMSVASSSPPLGPPNLHPIPTLSTGQIKMQQKCWKFSPFCSTFYKFIYFIWLTLLKIPTSWRLRKNQCTKWDPKRLSSPFPFSFSPPLSSLCQFSCEWGRSRPWEEGEVGPVGRGQHGCKSPFEKEPSFLHEELLSTINKVVNPHNGPSALLVSRYPL